jgi:cell division protein FtsL
MLVFLALGSLLTVTMLGLVEQRQQARALFIELQAVRTALDEQETLRTRLQLEQSTLANIARVKRLAEQELAMRRPDDIRVLALPDGARDPGGRP